MTIALAAIAVALLITHFLDRREHTRQVDTLITNQADTTQAFIHQIDRLCQRLQAPEQAVIEHAVHAFTETPPEPVAMDDDTAHWEAKGVDKNELADLVMAAELAG